MGFLYQNAIHILWNFRTLHQLLWTLWVDLLTQPQLELAWVEMFLFHLPWEIKKNIKYWQYFNIAKLRQFSRSKNLTFHLKIKVNKKIAVSEVFLVPFSFQILWWTFISHLHICGDKLILMHKNYLNQNRKEK